MDRPIGRSLKKCVMDFQIEQHFKILKAIGQGGYGVVLKVEDRNTGLIKAAKIVSRSTIGEDHYWPILSHPSIMKLHETSTLPHWGRFYIMSLFKHDLFSLYSSLEFSYRPDSFARKKRHAWQILNGLNYLHSSRMCHFNLKGENIMVCSITDTAIICDFSTLRRIHKNEIFNFALRHSHQPPECLTNRHDRSKAGWYLAEMWTFGILAIETFSMDALDLHIKHSDNFNENILNFLASYKRKPTMHSILIKAHPRAALSIADAEELISFLNQFLVFIPQNRVSAGKAMRHTFMRSSATPYSDPNNPQISHSGRSSTTSAETLFVYKKQLQDMKCRTRMNPFKVRGDRGCRDFSGLEIRKMADDITQQLHFLDNNGSFHRSESDDSSKAMAIKGRDDNRPILDCDSRSHMQLARDVSHEGATYLKSGPNSVEDLPEKEIKTSCFPQFFRSRRPLQLNEDAYKPVPTGSNTATEGKLEMRTNSAFHDNTVSSASYLCKTQTIKKNKASTNDLINSRAVVDNRAENIVNSKSCNKKLVRVEVIEVKQTLLNAQVPLNTQNEDSNVANTYFLDGNAQNSIKSTPEKNLPEKCQLRSCTSRKSPHCFLSNHGCKRDSKFNCNASSANDPGLEINGDGQSYITVEQISPDNKHSTMEPNDNAVTEETLSSCNVFHNENGKNGKSPMKK